MLDDRKMRVIEMHLRGISNPEISKAIGVSRQTVWNWLNDDEMKKEVDRFRRENHILLKNRFGAESMSAMDRIVYLSQHAESEKIQSECAMYIVDQYNGKATTKIEQSTTENQGVKTTQEDILAAIEWAKEQNNK